jgi:hypothetical protein
MSGLGTPVIVLIGDFLVWGCWACAVVAVSVFVAWELGLLRLVSC